MRTELAKIENTRGTFTGTFIRFGTKNGYRHKKPTVLLSDIRNDKGKVITDHSWFNYTKEFKRLWEAEDKKLRTGNIIQFVARVKIYTKGYRKDDWDYRLSHPSKLSILEKVDSEWITEANTDPPFKYLQDFFFYTHYYFKFDNPTYTTIRGLNALEYHELNQPVYAKSRKRIFHTAKIIKIEKRSLSSMSLAFLKADCEYLGFTIYSKTDFVDLINSFRKNKRSHITEKQDPKFAVFTIFKLCEKRPEPNIISKPKIVSSLNSYLGVK